LVWKTKTSLTGKVLSFSDQRLGTSPLLLRLCYGFSVLRFENRLVLQEPEFVKNEIRKAFKNKDPELE
jgi:hypothetical protein